MELVSFSGPRRCQRHLAGFSIQKKSSVWISLINCGVVNKHLKGSIYFNFIMLAHEIFPQPVEIRRKCAMLGGDDQVIFRSTYFLNFRVSTAPIKLATRDNGPCTGLGTRELRKAAEGCAYEDPDSSGENRFSGGADVTVTNTSRVQHSGVAAEEGEGPKSLGYRLHAVALPRKETERIICQLPFSEFQNLQ